MDENYKQFADSVHGPIKISNIACKIIDSLEFQRLRYLHQLGTCYYVFPNASHTRFEHSIGTYYVAGWILKSIKKNSNTNEINKWLERVEELKDYYKDKDKTYYKLDNFICELVKIAALCHDLGHGPFSHVFDDVFVPTMKKIKNKEEEEDPMECHETRSCLILESIIKNNEYLKNTIGDNEILFIKNLINPGKNHTGFIYQIVSNSLNSIDVDKFDYLKRDIRSLNLKFGFDNERLLDDAKVLNNIICYPIQMYYEVASIFSTRYRLHKQIYCHKMVISVQFMINDIMLLIDPIIKIYDSIFDIKEFSKLTDNYILETVKFLYWNKLTLNFNDEQIERIDKAYNLLLKINTRLLYRYVGTTVSKRELDLSFLNIFGTESGINEEDVLIYKTKIGFVSGKKKNPIKDLYFYENKDDTVCCKIKKEEITFLISDVYQEYICMVFVKDRTNLELVEKVRVIFKEFDKNVIKK